MSHLLQKNQSMRLPSFLIIGAAKSGTTTLYHYLSQHPNIYMPYRKEPAFFAVDEKYAQGLEWYASLFNDAKPDQICGEASTDYTKFPQYPETAARIAQTLPEVKMIYIMRNPVDRAYAYYMHWGRQLGYKETFEERMKQTNIYLDASYYIMQIEQYLQFFPKESFRFLLMDDLIQQPAKSLQEICQFIGVSHDIDLMSNMGIVANSGKKILQYKIRNQITAPLRKIPGFTSLSSLVPQQGREWIYKQLKNFSYGKTLKNFTPLNLCYLKLANTY